MSTDAKTRRGFGAATSRRRDCSMTGRGGGAEPGSSRRRRSRAQQDYRLGNNDFLDALGVLDRRVHGAGLLGAFSHQAAPHISEEEEVSVEASEQEKTTLRLFLQDIERSIVFGICRNPEAREFFRDHRRRLDDYFAAAKNLLQLLQHPAVVVSGDLHGRAKSLLFTAMSSLATELCHLRIWKPDALTRYLGCTPASIWELARSSCRGDGGSSSAASTASWMSTSYSSSGGSSRTSDTCFDGYLMKLGEERSVQSGPPSAGFIDLKSVSTFNKIAGFMIEVGYEEMIQGAFDRHREHLVRYIEILDIDNILGNHMEETTELRQAIWTSTMRIVFSVLDEMRRQLNKDYGPFSSLKEDYLSAIAKVLVMKLIEYASVICIQVDRSNAPSYRNAEVKNDTSKMVNVVTMYQSLEYSKLEILDLLSGQTNDLIMAKIERLTYGLSALFLELVSELNNWLRSQHLVISNTGVHRVTRHIMDLVRLLVEQKNTVHVMLNGNPDKFRKVVTQVISSLEFLLDMNSRSLALQGQKYVFHLSNMNFMLEQVDKYTDLKLILGESWCLQRHVQFDQFMASYVESSWTPVMSSFKRTRIPTILWPHQLFDKFTSRFEKTYNVQKTWKVTDPVLRQKLREAITQKVIPSYRMYLESYSECKQKSVRHNVEYLEARLMNMFEG